MASKKKETVEVEYSDGGYKGKKTKISFKKQKSLVNECEILNIDGIEVVVNKFIPDNLLREIIGTSLEMAYSTIKKRDYDIFDETALTMFKRTFRLVAFQTMTNLDIDKNDSYDDIMGSVVYHEAIKQIINYQECYDFYMMIVNNFVVTETIAMLLDNAFNTDEMLNALDESFDGMSQLDKDKLKLLVKQQLWEEYEKNDSKKEITDEEKKKMS